MDTDERIKKIQDYYDKLVNNFITRHKQLEKALAESKLEAREYKFKYQELLKEFHQAKDIDDITERTE